MNERIKQLAVEAGFVDKGNNITAYLNFDHEKFAELIVRECIAKIEEAAEYSPELYGVALDIQEHFGVES